MVKKENNIYISYATEIFEYFKRLGCKTGEGGPYLQKLDGVHSADNILHAKFLKHTVKNLILTGYLEMKDMRFICLTEFGYDFTQGGFLRCNQIDLLRYVDLQRNREYQFNQLWEIIGNDKTALFYMDGPSYYKLAISMLEGFPDSYSLYIKGLNKTKQSRQIWFRELYYGIADNDKAKFLKGLSDVIANTYEEYYPMTQNVADDDLTDWAASPMEENVINKNSMTMQTDKKVKLFISHSSKDKKYIEAFVDLLIILGINKPEQLFCSSCPPFDVKVNGDIYETLKEQYQNYNLFMIYMLSDNYYDSPVCLNEMGAGWVLQNDYQCITIPGFSPSNIKGCVSGQKKALVLDSEHLNTDLNTFKDIIISMMKLPTVNNDIWEMKRDRFIRAISE